MNILEQIIDYKKKEVEKRKQDRPVEDLHVSRFFGRETLSLREYILKPRKTGIIAEFKRKSPSKGIINNRDSVEGVTRAYAAFGASGISILTDYHFFGGSPDDLISARDNGLPLLRKDFIIDEYQIVEAKAFGADAIMLIAACLSKKQVKELAHFAKDLGLEVLLELHEESELEHICSQVDLVGVNNRSLKTFEVNLDHSVLLAEKIGPNFVKVAESGISSVKDIHFLQSHGFKGFLIGEYFMKQNSPAETFKNFIYEL